MAGDIANGGAMAYDVSGLDKLKYTAAHKPDAGRHEAAKQFEAMFIKQMLSNMRKAIPLSHLLGDSSASKQYQDMMDAQWSQTLAQRGIGLATMLEKQLGGAGATSASAPRETDLANASGVPEAKPRALAPSESLAAIEAQRAASGQNHASMTGHETAPVVGMSQSPAEPLFALDDVRDVFDNALSPKVRAFVDQLGGPARMAAGRTGLSPQLILAQAALETGWGRHEITTDSGQPSFNVFNIKSTGWDGATAQVTTHEYTDGTKQATRAGFRVYDSYDQAFSDYARLINDSPRYAAAREAATPDAAARALQDGGYATDPAYADKLVSVMKSLPASHTPGLFSDSHGPIVDMSATGNPLT
ncbi:flagellar assembly peptidoglycan hydrolase FlgJ [Salinisphaera sp. Q1T1-3]|uniref:flagellar assembly peptidoglycan hydrolase FlgJ n=1 Tax=Salinisphaera sp. Q1T1-3 TaxID=2321229 RepID=UPI000E70C438|nr:flagellar assembly peptidoglycan hydrolase FlgJ [Salinisphaera sp. Q1T1-3]RJS95167.1 flagellar assembly peptidoglycan hydrolase FlgJ [Salinisphaera sp. Q1T1-3]